MYKNLFDKCLKRIHRMVNTFKKVPKILYFPSHWDLSSGFTLNFAYSANT